MIRRPLIGALGGLFVAGAAGAQTLPASEDAGWQVVGTEGGATYAVMPSSVMREGGLTRFTLRANWPPAPSGGLNAMVVKARVDCTAGTIGIGTRELYDVNRGFQRTVEAPDAPLATPTDPGQSLLIRHVCAANP